MATVATPNSVLKEGYEGITTQPFRAESCFQRSAPGVAMVAVVATSQKSHKVRVERSGAKIFLNKDAGGASIARSLVASDRSDKSPGLHP